MSFIRMEYGWWYVQFSNGKRGWVDKQYVTRVSAKVSGSYSVTASVLNVRNYPRVSATLIGRLRRGTVVSVEKLNGDWAYIAYKGKHGWVATKYLSR